MATPSEKIAVLGGGSFGTAIANIVADNGHAVTQWMRDEDIVASMRTSNENSRYLPGKKLNPTIVPTTRLGELVMRELKRIHTVAYARFASVYRSLADVDELRQLTRDI
mgnify:CR=1 FL=1